MENIPENFSTDIIPETRGLTGLELKNTVKTIGNFAFAGCNNFTGDLIIPKGVNSIGEQSFAGCNGFSGDLVLPEGLESMGSNPFVMCSGFTGKLVVGMKNIPPFFFSRLGEVGFRSFTEIEITNTVKTIGESAFTSVHADLSTVETVRIASSVTKIESKGIEVGRSGGNVTIYVDGYSQKPDAWAEDWTLDEDFVSVVWNGNDTP